MIQKILCPLDFSAHSRMTLDCAVSLAKAFDAKLILYYVVESVHGEDMFLVLAMTPQEIEERLEQQAKERMQAIVADIKDDIDLEVEFGKGKAFVEIIKKARVEDVDLIVIGSRGNSSLPHILLGGVAEKVARKAPCSVLIVKDKNSVFRMP
ncbi:MAG: universal stress protein [candidate division KSB1 bacterium]|nr:universal stress protein [candidate division KSB1 bacterium]